MTLAEELHFGRTAERLYVSVARVSQAIKKQERELGSELFTRDTRNVRLTPAGERLRDDLRPVTLDMLADFRLPTAGSFPRYWEDGHIPFYATGSRPLERGLQVDNTDQILTATSTGEIVTIHPAHVTRYWAVPTSSGCPSATSDRFASHPCGAQTRKPSPSAPLGKSYAT